MLLSMTGFGKATVEIPNKKITVEIKSLNSKQMDLTARVPMAYRDRELELRNMVSAELQRGKADMIVCVETRSAEPLSCINTELLAAYKRQFEEASMAIGIPTPADWYSVLLRFPDVTTSNAPAEVSDEEYKALTEATREAIAALMAYRRVEGAKLEEFFTVRINRIAELLRSVEPYEKERVEKIRARVADGLSKITLVDYDKGRLEQEMIFYIEKLDVNEEKQRLAQHLEYFLETLALPTPGQGKKLGFIAQEMGREINTLGSKSNHAEMQRIVVKMKDELEQIKEQVLNVM